MKNLIEKIIKKRNTVIVGWLIFIALLLLVSLFISDFNYLKILVFFNLLLLIGATGFFVYIQKIPSEKESSIFLTVQNLLDCLKEGLVIYDQDLKIIFVNQAFINLVNLKKEDLINLQVGQWMIKNEKYEMLANIFFPFLQGEDLKIINQKPEIIEVRFIKPKEKIFLITYLDIYLDKQYKLRIVYDRTEDILESQRRLEFIQLVSHNLLTPLSEIRWSLEAIDLNKIDEENKQLIETSLRIIKNTTNFVSSILTFLRTESGRLELKIEEIYLEKVFINILDILKEKIEEKKLKVNIEISEKAEKVPGDLSLITSALFSIIENAVVYNKIGGLVEITTRKEPQRPYVEIKIKDTGIGMSEEELKNLFKKYYRGEIAKQLEAKGFGIGLYSARSIINLHGGEIKIESEKEKGTTVTILLPTDPTLIPK